MVFKSLVLALSLYGRTSAELDWALPRRLQSSLRVEKESKVFLFTESMMKSKRRETARDRELDLFQNLDLLIDCCNLKLGALKRGNRTAEANKRVYCRLTS